MADPLSIASGVVALATFALTSSLNLFTTIRDFQSQDKKARALKSELGDLTAVLQSLLETVTNHPDIDFDALKPALHRCGNACKDYGALIKRFTARTSESRSSFRDWVTQRYLQGDITDFKDMLAGYKGTINIALANANIRIAAITPKVLEDYKDMIADTTHDLKEHLRSLDSKIQRLSGTARDSNHANIEWQAMIEEKRSTQKGLEICAQLSTQIEQLESVPPEHSQFVHQPSAHKYMRNGLDATKNAIQMLVSQLQNHEDKIDQRVESMLSTAPQSDDVTTELAQLRETKESIRQCIKVISDANNTSEVERHNVFEDITLADDAYNLTISTVGDLVTARRINLTGRSRHIGGQISDESYQRTIDVLAKEGITNAQQLAQDIGRAIPTTSADQGGEQTRFLDRHGRGFRLEQQSAEGAGRPPIP